MYEKGTTLIIKIGALGDVVRTSFIAQALKERTGNKIVWLTSKVAKSLFINNPYVDEIVTIDEKEKLKNISYNEVINLEEDDELCKFSSGLKYKKIKGFVYVDDKISPTETAREMFNMSYIGPSPMNNILKMKNKKTYRQLIGEIVGVDWEAYEPFLKLTRGQLNTKAKFMERHTLSSEDLIIGINSGSADRWPKALPINKTAKLIEDINNTYNCQVVLFGGPNEIERNKKICSLFRAPVINT